MCELKSWIEKDGKVLHLTDIDLRDKTIKERLKGCAPEDLIGHGAIRKAFNIEGGEQKEVKEFWTLSLFPKEIQSTLRDFDRYYSWMFSHCLSNYDLFYILKYCPDEKYRKLAQKELDK